MKTLKLNRIALILLLVLTTFLDFNCKPVPDSTPMNYYAIPQDVKDVIGFKKGTYWVYKDSISGAVDSQFVDSFKLVVDTVRNNSSSLHGYYEGIHTYIRATFDTSHTDFYVSKGYVTNSKDLIGLADKFKKHGGDRGQGAFLVFPFSDSSSQIETAVSGTYFDKLNNTNYFLTWFYKGNTYSKVVRVTHSFDAAELQPDVYYFAAHVGIIRRELRQKHHIWTLAGSHIVQ